MPRHNGKRNPRWWFRQNNSTSVVVIAIGSLAQKALELPNLISSGVKAAKVIKVVGDAVHVRIPNTRQAREQVIRLMDS